MGIFSDSFRNLRDLLGLTDSPQRPGFNMTNDILNKPEGKNAALTLYGRSFYNQAPNLSKLVQSHGNQIYNQYEAAAATDPQLMFTTFLDRYDPYHALYKQLTPFERGENPRGFSRSFRTLVS